jgi:hypothetical protein
MKIINFNYELINTDHIPSELIEKIQEALSLRVYSCQLDFEETLDVGHEINVIDEPYTIGEAEVKEIKFNDGGTCEVKLDLSPIEFDKEMYEAQKI